MNESIESATASIGEIVRETINTEMKQMNDRISKSETTLDSSFNIAHRRVDGFAAQLKSFDEGISNTGIVMEKKLDNCEQSTNNATDRLNSLATDQATERDTVNNPRITLPTV
jgi:hypothetical protein